MKRYLHLHQDYDPWILWMATPWTHRKINIVNRQIPSVISVGDAAFPLPRCTLVAEQACVEALRNLTTLVQHLVKRYLGA